MYEQFRNRMLSELEGLDAETIGIVMEKLDYVAKDFDIKAAERSLVIYQGGIPQEAKFFLVSMKMKGLSDGTLKNYQLCLTNFFRIVSKPLESVVANDIRAYFYLYRQNNAISDRTADKYRQYLQSFFSWLVDNEYIQKNPMRNVERIRYEVIPRQNFDHMDLEKIRAVCRTPREKAIVELFYSTGCRIAEMAALRKDDIDFQTGTVHLFGKGRKHRTSFLNAKATLALREYFSSRTDSSDHVIAGKHGKDGVSTASIRRCFEEICSRTDIDKRCVPHVMRHTTATLALNAGMPLDQVSKLLGHSSISTTQIYAKRDVSEVHSSHGKYLA